MFPFDCLDSETETIVMEIDVPSSMYVTLNLTQKMETTTPMEDTFMGKVETFMTFKIANSLNMYWFPVLIPLGLLGNTLSFSVMVKPNNRKMSTCIYMAGISINDNIMMFKSLHNWLVSAVKVHSFKPLECRFASFWALFGLQNSTFQVLAMTIDKYVAIRWPHKAATYSTPRRAKVITIGLFTGLVIYNIPHLFLARLIGDQCFGYSAEGIFTKVYSWLNFALNAIIPFTLLIYMNCTIVKTVGESRKMFEIGDKNADVNQRHKRYSQGINKGMENRRKTMKSTENQLTVMLLLVTTLFLILLIPTYVRFIFMTFFEPDTPDKYSLAMLLYQISHKLYHTNNGINFFLYFMSGRKFRNELREILCCAMNFSDTGRNEGNSNVTEMSCV